MPIHPTAIIDPKAEIDPAADIGPYVVIEGPVRVGAETRVMAGAYLCGDTHIGQRCTIFPHAVLGGEPQDVGYKGGPSYVRIGNDCIFREGATVHRGTQPETSTIIGDECYFFAYAHAAHNCVLGRGVKVLNNACLAGHVTVDDLATISAGGMVHQFCRVGRLAYIAALTRVHMDIPPFMMAHGECTIVQHNPIGMRRAGYDRESLLEIREAVRILYRSGQLFPKAVARLAETVRTEAGRELVAFLQSPSKRGIAHGRRHEVQPAEPM